jgi:hypothetical protein
MASNCLQNLEAGEAQERRHSVSWTTPLHICTVAPFPLGGLRLKAVRELDSHMYCEHFPIIPKPISQGQLRMP